MVYLDFFLWTAIRGERQGPGWGQEMQFSGSTVGEAELAVVDLVLSQSVSQSLRHTQVNAAVWKVRLWEHLCDSKIEKGDRSSLKNNDYPHITNGVEINALSSQLHCVNCLFTVRMLRSCSQVMCSLFAEKKREVKRTSVGGKNYFMKHFFRV